MGVLVSIARDSSRLFLINHPFLRDRLGLIDSSVCQGLIRLFQQEIYSAKTGVHLRQYVRYCRAGCSLPSQGWCFRAAVNARVRSALI